MRLHGVLLPARASLVASGAKYLALATGVPPVARHTHEDCGLRLGLAAPHPPQRTYQANDERVVLLDPHELLGVSALGLSGPGTSGGVGKQGVWGEMARLVG